MMEIEGQLVVSQPLVLTGLVVVSGTGGGGGGTDNYNDLNNKPKVNGNTLVGNKTSSQLGLADEVHQHQVADISDFPSIPTQLVELQDDSTHRTVTDTEKASWNSKSEVSGTVVGNDWTSITIDGVQHNIPSVSGTDIARTHAGAQSGSYTATFNGRGYTDISTGADISVTLAVNTLSDCYLGIYNTGGTDISVTLAAVQYNGSTPSTVRVPSDGISVKAGKYTVIGIVADGTLAVITTSNTLQ